MKSVSFLLISLILYAGAQNSHAEEKSARFHWTMSKGQTLDVRWVAKDRGKDWQGLSSEESFDIQMTWTAARAFNGEGRMQIVIRKLKWTFEDEDVEVDLNFEEGSAPEGRWVQKKGSKKTKKDVEDQARSLFANIKASLNKKYDAVIPFHGHFVVCERDKRGLQLPVAQLFQSLFTPPPLPLGDLTKGMKWTPRAKHLPDFIDDTEESRRDLKLKVTSISPTTISIGLHNSRSYSYLSEPICNFAPQTVKRFGVNTVVVKTRYDRRGFLSSCESRYVGYCNSVMWVRGSKEKKDKRKIWRRASSKLTFSLPKALSKQP